MEELTIKDVARICGVGVSTVSRAINNHPDINPETGDVRGIKKDTVSALRLDAVAASGFRLARGKAAGEVPG